MKPCYGTISGDVCSIKAWPDGKHFTLCRLDGVGCYSGLREGEFKRYTDDENKLVEGMLALKEARRLIVEGGESTDVPLQFAQHGWLNVDQPKAVEGLESLLNTL